MKSELPCEFPDDDGPCLIHGTALCHIAPIERLPNTSRDEE